MYFKRYTNGVYRMNQSFITFTIAQNWLLLHIILVFLDLQGVTIIIIIT